MIFQICQVFGYYCQDANSPPIWQKCSSCDVKPPGFTGKSRGKPGGSCKILVEKGDEKNSEKNVKIIKSP